MGRFQLELIYPYFPPSYILILDGTTVENKGKLILTYITSSKQYAASLGRIIAYF